MSRNKREEKRAGGRLPAMRVMLAAAVALAVALVGACADDAAEPRRDSATPIVATTTALETPSASIAQPVTAGAQLLRVRQVIDGDTITVSGVGTVRLLGVDAPEKTGGFRQAEPFGDAATRFMRDLVEGKLVRLEYDGERKDDYDRTLAYVFLEDGTLVNEAIIRAGYAETYRRFTYWRKPAFQAAEQEARAARRGMWDAGRTAPTPRRRP